MATGQRALKTDGNGNAIQAGVAVGSVINTSISVVLGFVAITVPAGIYTKEIHIATRDAASFQLSAVSNGATYATIPSGFWFKIAADPAQILFYAKGTSTTTLEVVILI